VTRFFQTRVPVLRSLKKVQIEGLVAYAVLMRFPKGTDIFLQGSASVSLYFIKKVK
jgi:hypothetical protein